MKLDNRRMVQFVQNCSPYLSGEKAAFPPEQARSLVERRLATYIDSKEPKKSEEVVLKDDIEQDAGNEPVAGETKEEAPEEVQKPKRKSREKRKKRVRE